MGWDGMGWDGMGWDGMDSIAQNGMGRDGIVLKLLLKLLFKSNPKYLLPKLGQLSSLLFVKFNLMNTNLIMLTNRDVGSCAYTYKTSGLYISIFLIVEQNKQTVHMNKS